jgi:hypothetical protein
VCSRRSAEAPARPFFRRAAAALAAAALVVAGPLAAQERPPSSSASRPHSHGSIAGRIVDAATGDPLPRVLVQLDALGQVLETDGDGRFEFTSVPPGRHRLFVSVVGYALVKHDVEVAAGAPTEVTLPLAEGTGTFRQDVTVVGEPAAGPEAGVPSQHVLGRAELHSLSGVLSADPMRAVQVMPGVATGDDFRAEFSVRGSAYRQIGLSLDGVPAPFVLHTVRGVSDTASIAILNTDILDQVTLSAGAFPQPFGNRTGAQIDFTTRDGSRERTIVRPAVSGISASAVAEGPFAGGRGSWLLSGRQSYPDWLVRRIDPQATGTLGFTDVQSRLVYDATGRHQLQLSVAAGSWADA